MLLERHANGIYGIPEITALTMDEDLCEFEISGLTPRGIINFLTTPHVGLSASKESILRRQALSDQDERVLLESISAYVRSGFPVILPVDLARLATRPEEEHWPEPESIYRRNKIDYTPRWQRSEIYYGNDLAQAEALNHAVVVVGQRKAAPGEQHVRPGHESMEFLINDPLQRPFLIANGKQLILARAYRKLEPATARQ